MAKAKKVGAAVEELLYSSYGEFIEKISLVSEKKGRLGLVINEEKCFLLPHENSLPIGMLDFIHKIEEKYKLPHMFYISNCNDEGYNPPEIEAIKKGKILYQKVKNN